MKVGLYARCSTKKQDLTSQLDQLMNWANLNGHDYIPFKDFAVSGKRDSRKGINALLTAARAGDIDAVAVIEISRIGRSIKFIYGLVEELNHLGVKLFLAGTNTQVDYDTVEGSAMVGALALAADIEWKLIRERNKRGRDTIKSKGIKVGRKNKSVSLEAVQLLRGAGKSYREIGVELNCSAATIMRVVHKAEESLLEDMEELEEDVSN